MARSVKRWDWAEQVMGPQGPDNHRLRLTAMALFMHMNEEGRCWVGQPRIAERTGFGERSVRRHVQSLERDGWIQRSFVKDSGKAWRRTVYTASIPDSVEAPANLSPHAGIPADGMPSQEAAAPVEKTYVPANAESVPAKPSEGAANLISDAVNRWPLNRDLEQGVEPVFKTSSAIPPRQKEYSPFQNPFSESRKPKNAHSFEQINERVEYAFVQLHLGGTAVSLTDYSLIRKLTGYTEQQVKAAITQLIDRRRLPVQPRKESAPKPAIELDDANLTR